MSALQLVIGNKNYSSWSMRPWIALEQAAIPFTEIQLSFDESAGFRVAGIEPYSPAKKVPVLLVDGESVWDSLAIIEWVAELFPDRALWPVDPVARRLARSLCAEMHSGFAQLRSAMPMNIRAQYPGKGHTPEVARDIARICEIWQSCRSRFGKSGPLLFGDFTAVDAYFAPVVMRFQCYLPPLPPEARAYCEAVQALPSVQKWCEEARKEEQFLIADEPYAAKV
jgi:glutathione S-transferase